MATTRSSRPDSSASRTGTPPSAAHGGDAGNGRGTGQADAAPPAVDPTYSLPLLGPLIAQADRFRTRLPLGPALNKSEAEVLRAEARALRAVAQYLETRAKQLDRLERERKGEKPRLRRVQVE